MGCWTVVAIGLGCTETPTPEAIAFAAAADTLDQRLQRWAGFGFSGAVLVARDNRVLLSQGYGLADRAERHPITPATLFDIGSVSKQFTGAAVLALAERGHLDLHASIATVLPGVPDDKRVITAHHLLTHTAGIADFGDEAESVSRDDLVRRILAEPLATLPGSEYAYSNLGYTLLAAMIEVASGQSFEMFLTEALFAPAAMSRTTFTWVSDAAGRPTAIGYGGYRHPTNGEDPRTRLASWRGRGSGNVLSNLEELWAWHQALHRGRILNRASLELLFGAHTEAEAEFLAYGYGWRSQPTSDGTRLIWHSGLDEAFSAMFRWYVEENVVMIFLSNQSIGGVPLREILVPPSRAGPPVTALLSPAVTAAPDYQAERLVDPSHYPGRYRVGASGEWEITSGLEPGALMLRATGQEAINALFPPDEATATAYETAGREATRVARCLVTDTCPATDHAHIDPLGFAARPATMIREAWRLLGTPREIQHLGTTGLRGRNPRQVVTHLRLVFPDSAVDEHVIRFADDEIYWIPGHPETFTVPFRPTAGGEIIGFDLLSQAVFRAGFEENEDLLIVEMGGERKTGRRVAP